MTKLMLLSLLSLQLISCTNESQKTHELLLDRYFKAAIPNPSTLRILHSQTSAQKRTAYTSVIKYSYTGNSGRIFHQSVTIETVGTNSNYIIVNGICISTDHLAERLADFHLSPQSSEVPAGSP